MCLEKIVVILTYRHPAMLCFLFPVFGEQVEKLLRAVADGDVQMVSSFLVT